MHAYFYASFISGNHNFIFVLDICSLPAETGVCRAYFERYFYNTTSERCDKFVYGGCDGNKNNFLKKSDCKSQCDDAGKIISGKNLNNCTRISFNES